MIFIIIILICVIYVVKNYDCKMIQNKKYIYLVFLFVIAGFSALSAKKENEAFFIENKGQVNDIYGKPTDEVFYVADTKGARVYFRNNGISYVFRKISGVAYPLGSDYHARQAAKEDTLTADYHRIDLKFSNAGKKNQIIPSEQAKGKLNVYNPNFPNGIEGICFFKKLTYKDLYPGIDAVFYIDDANSLKYEFVVSPGASPDLIKLIVSGADEVQSVSGNLKIACPLGEVTEMEPYSYQRVMAAGDLNAITDSRQIGSRFVIKNNEVSFNLDYYDNGKTLIIDPNVTWSSFYGGSDADHGYAIATNKVDYVVLTGSTISNDFPVSPGAHQATIAGSYDLYVTYMDYDGNIFWTTLYGGTLNDYVNDVTTDSDLGIYIGGWTWSPDFPLTAGAYQSNWGGYENDAIIVKFDSLGRRKWATFVGGNNTEHLYKIACDSKDDIVVTGWTNSTTFSQAPFAVEPGAYQGLPAGAEDIFLAKFDSSGKYLWGTFMGRDSTDEALGLAIDRNDNIYITGYTKSSNFPVTPGAHFNFGIGLRDCYFSQFSQKGSLVYSTLFGGTENDYGEGIAVDSSLNIYIVGSSSSIDYPVTPGCLQKNMKGTGDATVTKFDKNKQLLWSSYFGSFGFDYSTEIIADRMNNVVITGRTFGNGMPVSGGAFSDTLNGLSDAFITKLNAKDGKLIWSTYYGGSNEELGRSLASDRYSNIYSTGSTLSSDFPLIDPPIQQNYGGLSDAYVMKQCVSEPNPDILSNGPLEFCLGKSVTLDAGAGYVRYKWNDGSNGRFLEVSQSGEYKVAVWDENFCIAYTEPVLVTVFPEPDLKITGKNKICYGEGTILSADKDYEKYLWSTGETTKEIFVDKIGFYELSVENSYGCSKSEKTAVSYYPVIVSDFDGPVIICASDTVKRYSVNQSNADKFQWTVIGGDINAGQNTKSIIVNWHTESDTGYVALNSYSDSSGCMDIDTLTVLIKKSFIPVITSSSSSNNLCMGDTVILSAEDGFKHYKWSTGETTREIPVWKEGVYEVQILDEAMCIGTNSFEIKVFPKPEPAITGDTVICSLGKAYLYSTTEIPGNSYLWLTGKGKFLDRPDAGIVNIAWDETGPDTVFVEETIDSTGCFSISKAFPVYVAGNPEITIKHETPLDFCEGDSVILYIDSDYREKIWFDGTRRDSIIIKEAGKYYIEAVNSLGCHGTDTVNVTVNPKPLKPVINQNDDSLYTGQYFKYTWKENGEDVPGSNNDKFVPSKNGIYSVFVENEFGCSQESDTIAFELMRAFSMISVKAQNMSDTLRAGSGRNSTALLYLDDSRNLKKFGATNFKAWLRFNKSLLLPIGSFDSQESSKTERFISVSGTLPEGQPILKEIEFAAALGDRQCTIIHLDSVVWNTKIEVLTKDGVFCLSDYCETDGSVRLLVLEEDLFFYNIPNPFADETEIVLAPGTEMHCTVTLSDIMGNKIKTIIDGLLPKGEYKYLLNTDGLASGIYYLRLDTPTRIIMRKVEIIK